MPVHLVSGADIRAVSIVGKGANRKRFFLFKAEADADGRQPGPLGQGRLIRKADWSAVYCVVAEPGWHEDPGVGAEHPEIDDRWASEEEIRKAAHGFMLNGGLLTKMHESMEPFGDLVESAIAPADFEVNGETIRKGSWFIAFQPTDEGKAAIEKGEFTGVSIEGFAHRELVEKGSTPAKRTVKGVDRKLLKRISDALVKRGDLSAEEVDALNKADRTFGELIAYREFDEILPDALEAFRDAVWYAFFPTDPGASDPVKLITESCDEFKAWALEQLESVPVEKEARAEALGVDLTGSTQGSSSLEKESHMAEKTPDNTERLEKLETTVETIGKGVAALVEKAKAEEADKAPTVDDLTKQLGEVSKSVEKLGEDIAKLGEGGTSQPVTKQDGDEAVTADEIKKAYEDAGLNPDLAGIV